MKNEWTPLSTPPAIDFAADDPNHLAAMTSGPVLVKFDHGGYAIARLEAWPIDGEEWETPRWVDNGRDGYTLATSRMIGWQRLPD